MRISESERTQFSRFREVTDLRIQFLCEYRLFLQQKLGEERTKASIEGERLHVELDRESQRDIPETQIIPLGIIVLTVIIGLLWILW